MSAQLGQQWLRKVSLVLISGANAEKGLDLSGFKIRFETKQFDEESPNTCRIKVYNLSDNTVKQIREEYTQVLLGAGYENGVFGQIFDGTIRQFAAGRESAIDSFLEILAADGDIAYNFGFVNGAIDVGSNSKQALERISKIISEPLPIGYIPDLTGTELPRGKVLFGMARDYIRDIANTNGCTWSIQNGQLQLIPLDSYMPGQAVVLNSESGMVGVPELTEEGVRVRTLINPNYKVGGLVKIDNKSINQLLQQGSNPLQFNSWKDIQHLAKVSADGLYRLYVVEHTGDTRGQEFYSDMVCLAVVQASNKVEPFGIGVDGP